MQDIDPPLAEFIGQSICSLWTLELLLLLHDDPKRGWSVAQADRQLRATPSLVAARFGQLETIGLARCDCDGFWRYAPRTEALADMIDALAAMSAERPFSVVNILLARGDARLRSFAEAFRLRPNRAP